MENIAKSERINSEAISNRNSLLQLRRTNNEINLLSNKMNSYTYEPCTHSLHQKFQSLKKRMENLKKDNDEIITSVEQGKTFMEDISEKVVQQIRDFNELRMGIFDYTNMLKSH
ncbi:hypothetical protein JQC67_13710 [Aurantibacter crassamenti]|uniref:hypothetical protein n=1 Tax=Aurantibacter crassamenti TaxID=1837375 RepID=UPI00193A22F4|nr:hypothetical protein [Aurantibacter crassamenti]MBM1107205.1 hypothetical protein [Aurantibacter crassamenti]